jgi:hypothetical protein
MPAANASTPRGAIPAAQQQTTRNPHGPLTIPCENCHTAAGWRPIRAVPEFDHNKTAYPLRGMHEKVACTLCHVKPVFTNVGKNCADCHADIHRRQFGPNCAQCHTVQGWDVATQTLKDHQNRFPLLGAHAAVDCSECHKGAATGIYFGLPTQCDSCHLKDWQNTTNPPHKANPSVFPSSNCQGCHSFDSWLGAKFDHSSTGFQLTNGHANVPCASCHINNNYNLQIAPTDCGNSGCHLSTWQQTTNPPHPKAGPVFAASNCVTCHSSTVSWSIVTFDHSSTGFQLTNGHANVPCASCHINNNYTLTIAPTDCGNSGCHLTKWQQTTTPVHSTSGPAFAAANCANCHTTQGWDAASFDHSITGFTLVGTHATTPCASCHVNNNYSLTSANTDCMSCHQSAWNSTQTLGGNVPNHVASNFPSTAAACSTCHTITTWADGKFDHSTTGFALTNSHQMSPAGKVTACTQCHIGGNYNLAIQPTDCGNSGCHLATWQQTNNPTHPAAGAAFAASNCSGCHNTTSWTTATFDHSSTGFQLTNGHANVPCASCHINNNYNLQIAPTDCGNAGCHLSKWQQTNNPVHSTSGAAFAAANCANCHTTKGWDAASFDHSVTGFALVGTHMSPSPTPCAACHVSNNYTLNSTDCMGCHQTAWNSTQTLGGNVPNHVAANFPSSASACSSCHTITVWANGKFDHSTTGFALTNSHQMSPAGKVTACTQCHVGGNYNLTSANTDCYGCHQTAWNSTQTLGGNVPNHVSAGFPTSLCSQCHDTLVWTDSTFNHANTGFTLTGTHATTPCASCHVNNNYSLTSANTDCMSCHQSAWNSTQTLGGNVPNHVAANFPSSASACSSCHTITVWANGKFDHSTTGFALTNSHQMSPAGKVTSCTQCHVNGNYTLTAANTACYGCHLADWNSTQTLGGSVPNHVAAAFPTTCDTCHTTTSWLGATFNHTWFPIPHGGEPSSPPCNDCHQVQTNFASFTCINCHTQTAHQQTQTNDNHQGVNGYSYGPTTCYSCHKNGGGG